MENKKQENKTNSNSIHSWFGWILTTMITLVLCFKILNSDFGLSQIQFGFTDFLSIAIALFAVWISINFYHKNNEASAKFYNNTYTFTKDISENLGRIEERFGEKLDSLKEENKSLSTRVEKYYSNTSSKKIDIVKDEKKEKEIQEKLKSELSEKDNLLNEFAEKYKIAEQDKNQFLEKINQKNEEVQKLEQKLKLFERSRIKIDAKYNVPSRITNFLRKTLAKDDELRTELFFAELMDETEVKDLFYRKSRKYLRGFLRDLIKYDLVDENEKLNETGIKLVMNIAEEVETEND